MITLSRIDFAYAFSVFKLLSKSKDCEEISCSNDEWLLNSKILFNEIISKLENF